MTRIPDTAAQAWSDARAGEKGGDEAGRLKAQARVASLRQSADWQDRVARMSYSPAQRRRCEAAAKSLRDEADALAATLSPEPRP